MQKRIKIILQFARGSLQKCKKIPCTIFLVEFATWTIAEVPCITIRKLKDATQIFPHRKKRDMITLCVCVAQCVIPIVKTCTQTLVGQAYYGTTLQTCTVPEGKEREGKRERMREERGREREEERDVEDTF